MFVFVFGPAAPLNPFEKEQCLFFAEVINMLSKNGDMKLILRRAAWRTPVLTGHLQPSPEYTKLVVKRKYITYVAREGWAFMR